MASVPSSEEFEILNQKLISFRDLVKDNPKEARRILQSAGILGKDGKVASRYRVKKERNNKS